MFRSCGYAQFHKKRVQFRLLGLGSTRAVEDALRGPVGLAGGAYQHQGGARFGHALAAAHSLRPEPPDQALAVLGQPRERVRVREGPRQELALEHPVPPLGGLPAGGLRAVAPETLGLSAQPGGRRLASARANLASSWTSPRASSCREGARRGGHRAVQPGTTRACQGTGARIGPSGRQLLLYDFPGGESLRP